MRWDLIPISDVIQMTAKRGVFPLAFSAARLRSWRAVFGKITSFNNFFTKIFVQNYDLYFPYYLL